LKHKPLNLGQGFPDFAPPQHVTDALADVAKDSNVMLHQYTRGYVSPTIKNYLSMLLADYKFLGTSANGCCTLKIVQSNDWKDY
jgi:kynurenine---oxoglutarate transaminase / cysteine-S-conjugate beta-lyase / glutamine---phenylpyruvate transaminase